jgi:hypothetical protein
MVSHLSRGDDRRLTLRRLWFLVALSTLPIMVAVRILGRVDSVGGLIFAGVLCLLSILEIIFIDGWLIQPILNERLFARRAGKAGATPFADPLAVLWRDDHDRKEPEANASKRPRVS